MYHYVRPSFRPTRLFLLLVAALCLVSTTVSAAPTTVTSPGSSRATDPGLPGLVSMSGASISDIVVIGSYGYLARQYSITILDLRNPDVSQAVASAVWPRGSTQLATNGQFLFNTTSDRHLQIIDVTHPVELVVRSEIEIPTYASKIAAAGTFIYLQLTYDQIQNGRWVQWSVLQVVDSSNPDQPRSRGQMAMQTALAFRVADTMIYTTLYNESPDDPPGVQLIDVGNPDSPRLRGSYPGSLALDIRVVGGFAYLSYVLHLETPAIDVLDIRNPDTIKRVGRVTFSGSAGTIYIAENSIVHTSQNAMRVFDIRNPIQPTLIANVPASYYSRMAGGTNAIVYGVNFTTVEAIDLTTPSAPRIRGAWSESLVGKATCVDGDYNYTFTYIGQGEGLSVVDIHNRTQPKIVGLLPVLDRSTAIWGMACENGLVAISVQTDTTENYMSVDHYTLYMIDVRDPTRPRLLTSYTLSKGGREVVFYEGYAYVLVHPFNSDGDFMGLLVLDIRDPANPVERKRIPGDSYTPPVLSRGRAYWTTYDQQTVVFDVTDPGVPVRLGSFMIDGDAIHADGTTLYALGNELQVIDATDVTWPRWLGSLPLPNTINTAVHGTTVYLALTDGTLFIIDAADPADMQVRGAYVIPQRLTVAADASYAYVYNTWTGLWILNGTIDSTAERAMTRLGVAVTNAVPTRSTASTNSESIRGAALRTETVFPNAWLTITTYNANGDVIPYAGRVYLIDPQQKALLPASIDLTLADQGRKTIPFHMPHNTQLNLVALDGATGVGTRFSVQTGAYYSMLPLIKR